MRNQNTPFSWLSVGCCGSFSTAKFTSRKVRKLDKQLVWAAFEVSGNCQGAMRKGLQFPRVLISSWQLKRRKNQKDDNLESHKEKNVYNNFNNKKNSEDVSPSYTLSSIATCTSIFC